MIRTQKDGNYPVSDEVGLSVESSSSSSSLSSTETFDNPVILCFWRQQSLHQDAALRAGLVPMCTPEILWALQTARDTQTAAHCCAKQMWIVSRRMILGWLAIHGQIGL